MNIKQVGNQRLTFKRNEKSTVSSTKKKYINNRKKDIRVNIMSWKKKE